MFLKLSYDQYQEDKHRYFKEHIYNWSANFWGALESDLKAGFFLHLTLTLNLQ